MGTTIFIICVAFTKYYKYNGVGRDYAPLLATYLLNISTNIILYNIK